MNKFIRDESDKTEFIAVFSKETSDIANKSHLYTCLRYMDNLRDIKETFFEQT